MRLALALVVTILCALPAVANERANRLAHAMKLDQVVGILIDEGMVHQQELEESLLDGDGGPLFHDQVQEIYNHSWMKSRLTEAFAEGMTKEQMDQAIVFFESDLGQTIVTLENSARKAFADEAIEEMANEAYEGTKPDSPRFELVEEYIRANDLIDQNVQGSLSSDYNFFLGLYGDSLAEYEEVLDGLLAQKDTVTEETTMWLYSFLLLAYQPLDEVEMRENIAFSRTETGQALNAALFKGFDEMFDGISYRLGAAVAQVWQSSDL
ncbi:DUF2059 domain-containing protein [Ruegeria sp. R13_0]|uniref:DUF2059 domain-containing protein n=1 Tax=Ruegeria sp. R13_0 TaxID=2821099 RepID=UPI001ADC2A58|nr:DUF2059 domain-containing protein [Ruegeria sp. R13_0]MBO9436479.1 DUF2059 domain-containing protein [Ruegeria sp. R13_0]